MTEFKTEGRLQKNCKSDCKLEFILVFGLLEALGASNGTDGVSLVFLNPFIPILVNVDDGIFEFPIG